MADPVPLSAPALLRSPTAKSNVSGIDDLLLLTKILSWKRPHNTDAEGEFIHQYIDTLDTEKDSYGNRFIRIGTAPLLYSCHVDTVHHSGGYQRLTVHPDGHGSHDLRVRRGDGNCLGADDGTGVWLMIQLLKARKPGLYVFHRGEECGCLGSKHISTKEADLLSGINYAVAFDRKGYNSIITHQMGTRCCSESFAKALAPLLGGVYGPDSTGSFTDTSSYVNQISECTNLSVGYFDQHGPTERQNTGFALQLRDKLLAIDFTALPHERNPRIKETKSYASSNPTSYTPHVPYTAPGRRSTGTTDLPDMNTYDMINRYPLGTAAFLEDNALTEELRNYLRTGLVPRKQLTDEDWEPPTPTIHPTWDEASASDAIEDEIDKYYGNLYHGG